MKKLLTIALLLGIQTSTFAYHVDCNVAEGSTCITTQSDPATMTYQGTKDNKFQKMICEYEALGADVGAKVKFNYPAQGSSTPEDIQIKKYSESNIPVTLRIEDPTAFICNKCNYSCQSWIGNRCMGDASNQCPVSPFPCFNRGGLSYVKTQFQVTKVGGDDYTAIKVTCHME